MFHVALPFTNFRQARVCTKNTQELRDNKISLLTKVNKRSLTQHELFVLNNQGVNVICFDRELLRRCHFLICQFYYKPVFSLKATAFNFKFPYNFFATFKQP